MPGVAVIFTDVFGPVYTNPLPKCCSCANPHRVQGHLTNKLHHPAPRKTLLVSVSDNEYFVATARKGRAHPVEQCCDLWHQFWDAVERHAAAFLILKVKSHVCERSLWSGHQPIWMFAGSEFADRLAWTVKKIGNKSILVFFITFPRKRLAVDECIKRGAHELVAGLDLSIVGGAGRSAAGRPKELLQPSCLLSCLCRPLPNIVDQGEAEQTEEDL